MSDKQKKKEAMDNLLNGLTMPGQSVAQEEQTQEPAAVTSPAEQVRAKGKRGRPPRSEKYRTKYHVVNVMEDDIMCGYADMFGLQIKEILEKYMKWGNERMKEKYGPAKIPRKKRINLDEL